MGLIFHSYIKTLVVVPMLDCEIAVKMKLCETLNILQVFSKTNISTVPLHK